MCLQTLRDLSSFVECLQIVPFKLNSQLYLSCVLQSISAFVDLVNSALFFVQSLPHGHHIRKGIGIMKLLFWLCRAQALHLRQEV